MAGINTGIDCMSEFDLIVWRVSKRLSIVWKGVNTVIDCVECVNTVIDCMGSRTCRVSVDEDLVGITPKG